MEHTMGLTPAPLAMIRSGQKTIELRLYDDKRKQIAVGDTIVFVNTENAEDRLEVKVTDLFVFDTFETLYRSLPLLQCGYTQADVGTASADDMEQYYSKERQSQCGVVGIQVELR